MTEQELPPSPITGDERGAGRPAIPVAIDLGVVVIVAVLGAMYLRADARTNKVALARDPKPAPGPDRPEVAKP